MEFYPHIINYSHLFLKFNDANYLKIRKYI